LESRCFFTNTPLRGISEKVWKSTGESVLDKEFEAEYTEDVS